MIRELREENEKLKKVLIQIAQGGPINLKELGVGYAEALARKALGRKGEGQRDSSA